MKKLSIFLILACSIALAGCSKDGEIESFITELDSTTKDITAKIDANPSSAGIDAAQKVYDDKKAGLKTKWDAVKGARGFQVSEATKKKLEDSVKNNVMALTGSMTKNMMKLASDKDANAKFQKLMKDYTDTFQP